MERNQRRISQASGKTQIFISLKKLSKNKRENKKSSMVLSGRGITPYKSSHRSRKSMRKASIKKLRRNLNSEIPKSHRFPVPPEEALSLFPTPLKPHEESEIFLYKKIYFLGNQPEFPEGERNMGYDDSKGFYRVFVGDQIAYRYEIQSVLGKGTFGRVCKCKDHKFRNEVALKIIKNEKEYFKQAQIEISILELLKKQDPTDSYHVVKIKKSFVFRGHVVIVFELLDMSLFEFIRSTEFMEAETIRTIALQLFRSLSFLRTNGIVHCDLKPDNIHFFNNSIKLIDFGLGCFESQKIHYYIQSRFYRAPEIVLGIPYTYAIDMWSVGCILAELCLGIPLFIAETEGELFGKMNRLLGPPPTHLMLKATKTQIIESHFVHEQCTQVEEVLEDQLKSKNFFFIDLVKKCLEWDPEKRITPTQALRHPFIKNIRKSFMSFG